MYSIISSEIIGSTFKIVNHRSPYFELFREDARFCHNTVIVASILEIFEYYYKIKNIPVKDVDAQELTLKYKSKILPYINRGFGTGAIFNTFTGNTKTYGSEGNGFLIRLVPLPLLQTKYNISKEDIYYWAKLLIKMTHDSQLVEIWGLQFLDMLYELKEAPEKKHNIIEKYAETFKVYIKKIMVLRGIAGNNIHTPYTLTIILSLLYYSDTQEEFITNTVSIGGDTDTLCAINGGISEYIWGRNQEWEDKSQPYFKPFDSWILKKVEELYQ